MVINGASLPESLLEALGMPSGGGFQIKLVRSGACCPALKTLRTRTGQSIELQGSPACCFGRVGLRLPCALVRR